MWHFQHVRTERGPSLQSIANAAGVSAMTVSRVLNQFPGVSETTRARVLEAARVLRYQPDPHLARMMHLIRGRKGSRVRAAIAVIRETAPDDGLSDAVHQFVPLEDIERRAQQHGYRVEEFWLGRDGMDARRVGRILDARGVEGVLVSPQSSRLWCAELDYTPYSAATFGYGLLRPSLHRATTNMMEGIRMALEELGARGYERVGLAVTQWVNERSQNAYTAALLDFQQRLPKRSRVPPLVFPSNNLALCGGVFSDWMVAQRPDAVISFDYHVPEWLDRLGLRVPEDVGFVVHDWAPRMAGVAGIHHRRDHVAAAAVDLVATQLLHNERGIPRVPWQILVLPEWIEGATIRARA
ncbi:MAG: hypothetical protein RLZZ244_2078 [Verrucomicrobiota bacterium]